MAAATNGWDVIVIGSGFGGAFAAIPLVEAGARVLMVERGDWVARGAHNSEPSGTMEHTPHHSLETPYEVVEGGQGPLAGITACVGGASVFYGGVSFRLRRDDFAPPREIVGDSGARWPIGYPDLEPHYERAESALEVAGQLGADPTDPPRRGPYPRPPGPLGETSAMIAAAGRDLGLKPFLLPLAVRYDGGGPRCLLCPTCDTFACPVSAKNDVATAVIPRLLARGMGLRTRTVVTRLVARSRRVTSVEAVDKARGERLELRGETFVLAAGALASSHLLLASDLPGLNPAGHAVGRFLTRHCSGIVMGLFPRVPDRGKRFHKQIGFHDYYFTAPGAPPGPLGSIQQLQTPPIALVEAQAPRWARGLVAAALPHATGLLVMAQDQPSADNGLTLSRTRRDAFGLQGAVVRHRHSPRDEAAREALLRMAHRILRQAGACFFYRHRIKTFSHAAGTVRFGEDPRSAPLDAGCGFRGVENLFVTDASFMPTVGGVNPSLTIAANALRVGVALAKARRA